MLSVYDGTGTFIPLSFSEIINQHGLVISDGSNDNCLRCDSNPYDFKDHNDKVYRDEIEKINKALGLPDEINEKMMDTRAVDGKQKEYYDKYTIIWLYDPDTGLEVIYQK